MGNVRRPGKKDAQLPRFIEGRAEEVQELFGAPVPILPEGPEATEDQPAFLVQLHPGLQPAFLNFLGTISRSLAESVGEPRESQQTEWAYFQLLLQITKNIIENERRSGLLNLFWLAHSKEVAATVHEYFNREGVPAYLKYQMHPLVRGFYRLLHRSTWHHFSSSAAQTLEYNLGNPFNHRLMESLFDDQLPLTELDMPRVNLEGVLIPQNRRFRLSGEEFRELGNVLRDRIRQGLIRQEYPLLDLVKAHLPTLDPSIYDQEAARVKMMFHPTIVTYLLTDYDETHGRLTSSSILKAARDRRGGWQHLFRDYLDLVQAVRRSEVIHRLRSNIALIPAGFVEIDLKEYFAEGRLFQFSEATEIVQSARKVTILFADLRGFTAASEGGISEVELSRSLYPVFDPVAGIVKRFKGQIDKFTGDGVMITFGTAQATPEDEMNALRTAIAIQGVVKELQAQGRMSYRMGISLHTGRAQISRFIRDEKSVDTTVIGRHVNIASRVTGSGSRPWELEDETRPQLGNVDQDVWIDQEGILYNWGIASTQEHVEVLRRSVPWQVEEGKRGTRYTYFDPQLQKKILIEYVGDAKLKGVGRAQPIYRVITA
ncbi:MAG: adenylate/guanylate cyclase domain-containing protein [Candidatus Methylomirabilales bacterium]